MAAERPAIFNLSPFDCWKLESCPANWTKSKKAHLVHLAPQAVAILQDLKPITGKKRHVFASPLKRGQPIYGRSVNNALATLFKCGRLPNVTQLRRAA